MPSRIRLLASFRGAGRRLSRTTTVLVLYFLAIMDADASA